MINNVEDLKKVIGFNADIIHKLDLFLVNTDLTDTQKQYLLKLFVDTHINAKIYK